MIRLLFTACLSFIVANQVMAHGKDSSYVKPITQEDEVRILESLDSMTALLLGKDQKSKLDINTIQLADSVKFPVFSDSVYKERMAAIVSMVPLTYNEHVKRFIDLYNERRRSQVEMMLGLSEVYFPMFEAEFDKQGLPMELKHLALVESALNPLAVSRAGATGIWQFMYTTGRLYDLDVNSYLDERRDPVKATAAAAKYFKNMYDVYGDWLLVIAAYNCGPGNVNKAIRRSGGKTTFWEIRRYLPRETRSYVPAFIAATYIFSYPGEHGFSITQPPYTYTAVDTLHLAKSTSFDKISEFCSISKEELRWLNPVYKKSIIPDLKEDCILRLPVKHLAAFESNRDTLFYQAPAPVYVAEAVVNNNTWNTSGKSSLNYYVKSGDNLGFIASWYDCRVQDLRNWNDIYGNTIRIGQRITVYVPSDKVSYYDEVNKLSYAEKQSREGKPKSQAVAQTKTKSSIKSSDYKYYTIKNGDTLWDIVQKFPGTTIEGLKRLNNISNSKSIKPGMVLKIERS